MSADPPQVDVIAWTRREALATVDGTRVRVRRNRAGAMWMCDEHGHGPDPNQCAHTSALAATPADPSKRRQRIRHRQNRSTTP